AASKVGLGAILPAGLSIPVFHKGGVVGEGGETWSGGALTSDEMFALLKKGEGVMTEEMMASMTNAQRQEFKRGNPYWWATGDPTSAGGSAGSAAASKDPLGTTYPNADELKGVFANIRPLLDTVGPNGAGPLVVRSMMQLAQGTMDYAKAYGDAVAQAQASAIGLPPGFDLKGTVPAGFDIPGWRSLFAANRGQNGNYPLLIQYLRAAGVPFIASSTVRPGAITVSGNLSNHALGRAVDFVAPNDANWDSPGLLRINHAFAPVMDLLS